MKKHSADEVKAALGQASIANSFMLLASLPIGDTVETRYGNITRVSLENYTIFIKRENELSDKFIEQTKKSPIEQLLNENN